MATRSRVLITGISGFTGQHLAAALSGAGWDVFGLSNSPSENSAWLTADLTETNRIADWIGAVRPTHVVHLAALSHVEGPPLPFYQVNVLGTESVLQAIDKADVSPAKVVIASSANIYGRTPVNPIGEDQPPLPANHYAASKAAMEWVARQWFDRLPIIVTRPFNYTGPGQSESFVFAKLAHAFRRREPMLTLGNLNVARDLSDVTFVTEVYRRLLLSDTNARVLNICSGHSLSIGKAVTILRDLSGHDPEIISDPSLMRANDIEVLTGDPSRLQAAVGPLEPVAPEQIFSRMLAPPDSANT